MSFILLHLVCAHFTLVLCSVSEIGLKRLFLSNESNILILPCQDTNKTNQNDVFGILNTLADLSKWASNEENIIQLLSKRIEIINLERKLIDEYLKDYEESSGNALKHLQNLTTDERGKVLGSSAVLSHRMASRYAGVLNALRVHLISHEPKQLHYELHYTKLLQVDETHSGSSKWIESQDLFMSMESFARIQQIHGYHPKDVTVKFGMQATKHSDPEISTLQSVEMGIFTLYREMHYMSHEWLEFTISKRLISEENQILNSLVDTLYLISVQTHNRVFSNLDYKNNYYKHRLELYGKPIPFSKVPGRKVMYTLSMLRMGINASNEAKFMSLCRENILQTPVIQASLVCYYEKHRHPYLYINPVKVEHLSVNPPIYQFYEMINETSIKKVYSNSIGKAKFSKVYQRDNTTEGLAGIRTSVGREVTYTEIPENVIKLAEIVTGLNILDLGDSMQYAEYTYGRFYTYHKDHFGNITKGEDVDKTWSRGDRMATLLYYLEIPEKGGLTPFCNAGIFARPVRKSAIFWYNLYKNGTARNDVTHGACPVLHGHKIILNHWLHYLDNWKTFKCSLNQYE